MRRIRLETLTTFIRSDYFLPCLFLFLLFFAGMGLWNHPFDEMGDEALIGLQTVRAGRFLETVGPYSRVGFHHPGPISFYYYAAADALLTFVQAPGQRYRVAQFLLNAALFLWFFRLLRRLLPGRFALLYTALFLVALVPAQKEYWFSVWGPSALIIPYLLFFVSYLGLSRGRVQDLLPGTIAAVIILHNHVSGVALLLPLSAVALYKLYRLRAQLTIDRPSWLSMAGAALFLLITSIPSLVDEFIGAGNLSSIFTYFTGHGAASRRFDVVLVYLTGYYLDPVRPLFEMHPVVWFGFLTALPLVVWNRLDVIWRSLHANLMLVFLLSLVGAMRISGDLVPHLFWHLYPFVAFHLLLAVISLGILFNVQPLAPRFLAWQGSLLVFALVLTVYRPAPIPPGPTQMDQILSEVRIYNGPYRLVFPAKSADFDRWVDAAGLALKLTRDGNEYCVDEEWSFMFPPGAVCPPHFQGTVLRLTSDESGRLVVKASAP